MTYSIRAFLLIYLLISITLITSFVMISMLLLSHHEIENQLNTELEEVGLYLDDLLTTVLEPASSIATSSSSQHRATNPSIPFNQEQIYTLSKELDSLQPLEMQLWRNGKLIFHTRNAPLTPFSQGKPGISSIMIQQHPWRVNTIASPEKNITIMLAKQEIKDQRLENKLTTDTIIISLIVYPFLGIAIWFIVGRALRPLKKVTEEVSHRAPSYLQPVGTRSVPAEISPLVKELNHLFIRLQEAFDREKRFTADAAHELKTPLAAISLQTQIALCTHTTQDRNTALKKIKEGVDRSTHVIQQLLTLSRMMPDATLEAPHRVYLAREITDIAALLAPDAITKHIELEFTNPDSKAIIQGHTAAIGILIRNLLDNAIRYTPKRGTVKISIEETNTEIVLAIADSGPGIPPELQERVFERFYRGIDTNGSPGSGLGLSIVQQIAQLHQGKIQLLNSPAGKGGLIVKAIFPRR